MGAEPGEAYVVLGLPTGFAAQALALADAMAPSPSAAGSR